MKPHSLAKTIVGKTCSKRRINLRSLPRVKKEWLLTIIRGRGITATFTVKASKRAEQERAASKTPMGKSTLDDFESPGTYRGDMRGWDDEVYAGQAIDFLTQTRDRKRPFFMQLNLEKPHTPYNVEEPYFSMYDRDSIEAYPSALPKNASLTYREQRKVRNEGIDEAGLREIQATYYGMVSKVDHLVGQVVAAIEAQGLFEDTVVMLWSDHGDYAGQYGLPEKWDTGFSDCLTHSVLVLAAPGLPSGKRVESLSDNTDIVPTLCELLEVSPPPGLHGGSLVPVAQGQGGANDGRDAVFSEGGHEAEMRGRFSFPDATNGKKNKKPIAIAPTPWPGHAWCARQPTSW